MAGSSICPSLRHLSELLLTTDRMRERLVTQKNCSPWGAEAELDISRVHHLITRHRQFCPRCRFDEVLQRGFSRETPLRSNLILTNKSRINS
jgi:hypothetical protein